MAIQFVGSKSLDDRRRRRLAVNGEGASAENLVPEDGTGRVESELVMSAAAAPWVPAYEWRIWTYGAMLGLVLIAVSFAVCQPSAFRPELAPLTSHLLEGPRPVLASVVQTSLWFLCAQLAILISWYRAQCKLDFQGRYRVWPWAAAFCLGAAFCSATHAHTLFGEIISNTEWFAWRSETVAWLLPACIASVLLAVRIDRDVRRGPSTVHTLRAAWLLGLSTAGLELFTRDLQDQVWFSAVRLIVPLFFVATMFLGLWLHSRVVAFVCPDPPEVAETSVTAPFLGLGRWCVQRVRAMIGFLFRWRRRAVANDESETKTKRRTRKAADAEEDAAPKRKRKAPAKRATKPKARPKVVEEEEEEEEEVEDESYSDEQNDSEDIDESDSSQSDSDWEEEEEEAPQPVRQSGRSTAASASTSASPSNRPAATNASGRPTQPTRPAQQSQANYEAEDSEDEESDDGDSSYRVDDGVTAEQLRGLTKRQKRDLRQKMKDQQRTQRR